MRDKLRGGAGAFPAVALSPNMAYSHIETAENARGIGVQTIETQLMQLRYQQFLLLTEMTPPSHLDPKSHFRAMTAAVT